MNAFFQIRHVSQEDNCVLWRFEIFGGELEAHRAEKALADTTLPTDVGDYSLEMQYGTLDLDDQVWDGALLDYVTWEVAEGDMPDLMEVWRTFFIQQVKATVGPVYQITP
jgi:hypothetical protein